jgi:hypothetical protein
MTNCEFLQGYYDLQRISAAAKTDLRFVARGLRQWRSCFPPCNRHVQTVNRAR